MKIIENKPIVLTNKGQLILLDNEEDLELFNKKNLVYWSRDTIGLRDDLKESE